MQKNSSNKFLTKIFLYKYRNLNKSNPIYNISIEFPNSNKKLLFCTKFQITNSIQIIFILNIKIQITDF